MLLGTAECSQAGLSSPDVIITGHHSTLASDRPGAKDQLLSEGGKHGTSNVRAGAAAGPY